MFSKLYKFSKLVMYLNSCSMDLGCDNKSFDEFYAKINDIVNSTFNLRDPSNNPI